MRNCAKLVVIAAVFLLVSGTGWGQEEEVIEQWASSFGDVSSLHPTASNAPGQIIGPPDNDCGEFIIRKGWAPGEPDKGIEWIDLGFDQFVFAYSIDIFESINPGAVKRVFIRDSEGTLHLIWEGEEGRLGWNLRRLSGNDVGSVGLLQPLPDHFGDTSFGDPAGRVCR